MKLWSNYCKEMKIASRGFYFYMEIVMAAILLAGLLLLVPVDSATVSQEVIFADLPAETLSAMIQKNFGEAGRIERAADTKVRLRPDTVTYFDEQTGQRFEETFPDKKTLALETWYSYDSVTGKHDQTIYFAQSLADMLRVAKAQKWYATEIFTDESGALQTRLLLFGSESTRYRKMIAATMNAASTPALLTAMESQPVLTLGADNVLNNRQSYMPLAVVIMNGLMGMLVVIAYLTIDKSSGLIRAMALTTVRTRSYLMSKVLVVLTTSLGSSLVVTVPVMGAQPNYPLFILTAALVSVLSSVIGLWIASFFEDAKSAFGVIILMMVLLMLPSMAYMIPAFAPLWMKLLPTYPMLQAVKETLLPSPDTGYVLLVCAGMAAASALLLWGADLRYKKTLGV